LPDAALSAQEHARCHQYCFRQEWQRMRSDLFDQFVRRIVVRKVASVPAAMSVPCGSPDDFCPEGGIADPRITTITTSMDDCLSGDAACASDDDCCSGICTMNGRCACFDAGHLCPSDGFCCSGNCQNHRCV
jgi:hypothetical protein